MMTVEPRLAMEIGRKTPMLSLLIKRVSQKQFNGEVTLHASEVLAVLLQMDSGNQERVGAEDGINTLLVAIAVTANQTILVLFHYSNRWATTPYCRRIARLIPALQRRRSLSRICLDLCARVSCTHRTSKFSYCSN